MFETTDRIAPATQPQRQGPPAAPSQQAEVIPLIETESHGEPAFRLHADPLQPSLYRIVWRWHFYAGVIVSPVLMIVAITGAMYVFKDELERVIYPGTMFIVPQSQTIPLERQLAVVESAYPGWKADTVEVDLDPTRATAVRIRQGEQSKRVYVNPHDGAIQGAIGDDSFFRVILTIHRQLFIGTTGRVVVELVTCWTIVLMMTGVYLWLPRRGRPIWGVVLPRLRANPYTVLRDLHAISGAALMPVAITIAATGLVYSLAWGSIYKYATEVTGGSDMTHHAAASNPAPLRLDDAVANTRKQFPAATFIDLQLPSGHQGTYTARARLGERSGPRYRATLTVDRSTSAIVSAKTSDQFPVLSWWRATWNYPLHVGTVLGMPTKVIWFCACLVLTALPITGLWMWWQRRPAGRTGFPRRSDRPLPVSMIAAIAVTSILMPTVGVSVLFVLAIEWIMRSKVAGRA